MTDMAELQEVAALLDLDAKEIRKVLPRVDSYYREKPIPKKSGGFRTLLIPLGALRKIQDKIQERMFSNLVYPSHLHGGVRKRSIKTNARPHVGKQVVMGADLKDYFPNIHPTRVEHVFERLGFSPGVSKILTRLTTCRFQLPQGPPTSPAIANLAIPRADARLKGLAQQQRLGHSRFVDDITLSGGKRLPKFGGLVARVVCEEGFKLKKGDRPDIQPNSGPQSVTGLSVNWKLNVTRAKRKQVLSEAATAVNKAEPLNSKVAGRMAYVRHINPNAGTRVAKQAKRLRENEKCSA